jgi:hypothetical protein
MQLKPTDTSTQGQAMKFDRWTLRGKDFIGVNYYGQTKYINTTDTTNLERIKAPFNGVQIMLGRIVVFLACR